jgi:diguanylate cyclase (GGDEF)-like protein
MSARGREKVPHLGFLAAVGVLGWTVLLLARVWAAPGLDRTGIDLPLGLFFLGIAGARFLAFRLVGETIVSLDSAFFFAAAFCLGDVRAGWLVAIALTVDAALRGSRSAPWLSADGGGRGESASEESEESASGRLRARILYVIYFGGMTGALLYGVARACHVDDLAAAAAFPVESDAALTRQVLWRVPVAGGTFLVLHYLLQAVRLRLAGRDLKTAGRMVLRGLSAEVKMLPLAVAIVLIYDPHRYLAFILLGATCLLINYVFNRRSQADSSLVQRVAELETLNRVARSLSTTLQLHVLLETLARETVTAVPGAALFTVSLWDDKQGLFVVDVYQRERGEFFRLTVPRGEGVSGWVAEHKQPLCIPDLRKARDRFDFGGPGDPAIRSWLGVPLLMYDAVIGVISVQSHERDAFGKDHLRLLEAIGGQAAIAIQNARLYELATVDGLTGLYVRRYFDSRLREEWRRSQRFETQFSLVIMDLDDFKTLNDTWGHPVGDRVLREVAQVVKRNMRGVDIAARYGGEEFAFILPRTGLVDAHAVAERIRADIADHRVVLDDKVLRVTASLGVAGFPESGEKDAAALLYRADVALYRAKATGKDRVEMYWPVEDPPAGTGATSASSEPGEAPNEHEEPRDQHDDHPPGHNEPPDPGENDEHAEPDGLDDVPTAVSDATGT